MDSELIDSNGSLTSCILALSILGTLKIKVLNLCLHLRMVYNYANLTDKKFTILLCCNSGIESFPEHIEVDHGAKIDLKSD